MGIRIIRELVIEDKLLEDDQKEDFRELNKVQKVRNLVKQLWIYLRVIEMVEVGVCLEILRRNIEINIFREE